MTGCAAKALHCLTLHSFQNKISSPPDSCLAEFGVNCWYFACISCSCSINLIPADWCKHLTVFVCFLSSPLTVKRGSQAVLVKCNCNSLTTNYFQPVTLIQNHLNSLQEQLKMSGSDLKERFNSAWATRVIRFCYTQRKHESTAGRLKRTYCPVKPRRGPAQHRIALNGISQH